MKFKPGDKVVCIDSSGTGVLWPLIKGKVYTVYLAIEGSVKFEDTRWYYNRIFRPYPLSEVEKVIYAINKLEAVYKILS
jgi:hypothetical protein